MRNPEECKYAVKLSKGEPACILEEDFCERVRFCEQEMQEREATGKDVDCGWR